MREFSQPALVQVGPDANICEAVWRNEREAPNAVVIARYVNGSWQDMTAKQFAEDVRAVTKGLIAKGLQPGERVTIMSSTRYEWTLLDYAIWSAGGVPVPIYETSSAEQVEWIDGDSGATFAVVENSKLATVTEGFRSRLPDLREILVIDGGAIDELRAAGANVPNSEVQARVATLKSDSMATLIYTSGTTGRPKGCELTHGNLVFEVDTIRKAASAFLTEGKSTVLFLPIAHVFGRVIQCACISARVKLGHWADVKTLVGQFPIYKPHFILSVPRVFEKIYNGAKAKAHAAGGAKAKIFDWAEGVGIAYSESLDTGGPTGPLKAKYAVANKLVFSKLQAATGGNVEYAVSGGAPLGARLGHFFRGSGITILEGYGLTETTAAATVNLPDAIRIGSVGRPLPGVTVRIADDGEILIKGGVVYRGYWHNEEATKEAIDSDGWFHSGDIGVIDSDGFVKITGRKKEILVTAGGKNVAPAVLEDRINAHPLVDISMVVGDQKPFIACLVTVDIETLPAWLAKNGKPESATLADLKDDPDLRAAIQTAVDDANNAVSKAEAIKKWEILPFTFTIETDEITPTMKLKRNVVMQKYASHVEALYEKPKA